MKILSLFKETGYSFNNLSDKEVLTKNMDALGIEPSEVNIKLYKDLIVNNTRKLFIPLRISSFRSSGESIEGIYTSNFLFNDCIQYEDRALNIIYDLITSNAARYKYESIFFNSHSHLVANNARVTQAERDRGQKIDYREIEESAAFKDISELITTAIINHKAVQLFLLSNPDVVQKLIVWNNYFHQHNIHVLKKEDEETINSFVPALKSIFNFLPNDKINHQDKIIKK